MFANSFRAELVKFRKRGPIWLVLSLWVVLFLLFNYVFPYVQSGVAKTRGTAVPTALLPSHLATTAITGYSFWGGSLILILGALWIGSEYGWGTFKTLFTARPPRLTVLAAQLAVLEVALAALVIASYGFSALASGLVASIAHAAVAFPGIGTLISSMASAWLIVSMWGLIGTALAAMTSGTTLSIGLGLVWAFAVENLVRAFTATIPFLATIDKFFPGANGEAVITSVARTTAAVGSGQAYATVAAYVVLGMLVTGLVIARRDVA